MYKNVVSHVQRSLWIIIFLISLHRGKSEPSSDFESTSFKKIAMTSTFIDKTLLIREVLNNNKTSMIAAPRKFGKSINLDTIKTFLEIEVDDNGRPESRSNYLTQPVKDTDNFRLFDDNNLKISKETSLMDEYFGRTPVLFIDFKCNRTIKSLECAINHFKQVVHETFKQYKYLVKSDKLAAGQKEYVELWCSDTDYKMFGKQRVSSALRELAEYLWRHFDHRRVYVLIDNHESAIRSAMYSVADDDVLDDIVRFSVCIMNAILKSNERYVQGGLMTGVSDIPAFGSPAHNLDDPDSFQIYRFLGDHRFVDFYGLTKEEVDGLFEDPKLKLGGNVKEVELKYGGYRTVNGKEIYNLYSVLHFIKEGELKTFWPVISPLRNITDLIKVKFINKCLNKLVKGSCINITVMDEVTSEDIALLRDFVLEKESQKTYSAKKYLFFLIEQGYLSYTPNVVKTDDETCVEVKIPNDEIKGYFTELLK